MKVPNAVHEAHPWVMGRIAPDFALLDAWELPATGRREDFGDLLECLARLDPTQSESVLSRALFAVRLRLGTLLRWDERTGDLPIPGCTETSLAERLPGELVGTAAHPALHPTVQEAAGGFVSLFRTEDEWAGEISNSTVHGVLQLTWVPDGKGAWQGRLAVYVKPRGLLGRGYLALIAPFRHVVVYPALLRQVGRAWDARVAR
ncbi:MAG TPA: DUF2867 domain-containing protein [Mycobacteriales bacterium]|nr:DUF2867 domain-containing protein [Mycobacteriales bacterium]